MKLNSKRDFILEIRGHRANYTEMRISCKTNYISYSIYTSFVIISSSSPSSLPELGQSEQGESKQLDSAGM